MRLQAGQRVGEYELVEPLGSGGFGQVWKGKHTVLGGLVAVKIPTHPDFVRQLRAEAILQHNLHHPGIVRTVTVNTTHDPPYLVMEFVEGESLRGMLKREEKLAPDRAVKIATEVLEALGYAHERGVVHRDVKPENILIGRDGRVRVTDFGLGRVSEKVSVSIALSGSLRTSGGASIKGTLRYMAPEQGEGGTVDARADLYAVGLVLHEMLKGYVFPVVIPIEGAPAHVSQAVWRAVQPRPEERFASAAEMAQALRAPWAGASSSRPHAGDAHVSEAVHRATKQRPDDRFASAPEMEQAPSGSRAGASSSKKTVLDELAEATGYKDYGPFARFLTWTLLGLTALYMAMCAVPRHLGYRAPKQPSQLEQRIEDYQRRYDPGTSGPYVPGTTKKLDE